MPDGTLDIRTLEIERYSVETQFDFNGQPSGYRLSFWGSNLALCEIAAYILRANEITVGPYTYIHALVSGGVSTPRASLLQLYVHSTERYSV